MATTVSLAGFPPVQHVSIYQASDTRPGRIIVHTMVVGRADAEVTALPRITSLEISTSSFVGKWSELRAVKTSRVRFGYMKTVLEDSRWKLRDTMMSGSWNERDTLGAVMTASQKTVQELIDLIKDATGLNILTGTLPAYHPPACWANVTAEDALRKLLDDTGCRMVYNPVTEAYTISQAATGPFPNLNGRIFRPAPPCNIKALNVETYPTLYEDRFEAEAVKLDRSTGAVATIAPALAADENDLEKQTRLRFWKPTEITHPAGSSVDKMVLMPFRAKAHLYAPWTLMLEKGRVIRDEWEPEPYHSPFIHPIASIADGLPWTSGGKVFVTDHPVLMTDGSGALLDNAKVLTSYYLKDIDDNFVRETKSVTIDPSATEELTVHVPWIRPVDSTEPDVSGSVWTALHDDVANAMAQKYKGEAGSVRFNTFLDLEGSGQVGAVRYTMTARPSRLNLRFQVAFNFIPGVQGAID